MKSNGLMTRFLRWTSILGSFMMLFIPEGRPSLIVGKERSLLRGVCIRIDPIIVAILKIPLAVHSVQLDDESGGDGAKYLSVTLD